VRRNNLEDEKIRNDRENKNKRQVHGCIQGKFKEAIRTLASEFFGFAASAFESDAGLRRTVFGKVKIPGFVICSLAFSILRTGFFKL
jgi:hypothetical protein